MKRIIFLDIDMVLNDTAFLRAAYDGAIMLARDVGDAKLIDPVRVERLNRIIAETGAEVVISSSWRIQHPHPGVANLLAERGFVGTVIGETPGNESRSAAIRSAIDRHKPGRWVVIDDIPMGKTFGGHFVHVKDGLEDRHVERAIERLR